MGEEGTPEGEVGGGGEGKGEVGQRAREGAQVEGEQLDLPLPTYLMSSSPLSRGVCCKVGANCLILSSSRGDCCHSNLRRFGPSEVSSGCPGGRTSHIESQLYMV